MLNFFTSASSISYIIWTWHALSHLPIAHTQSSSGMQIIVKHLCIQIQVPTEKYSASRILLKCLVEHEFSRCKTIDTDVHDNRKIKTGLLLDIKTSGPATRVGVSGVTTLGNHFCNTWKCIYN